MSISDTVIAIFTKFVRFLEFSKFQWQIRLILTEEKFFSKTGVPQHNKGIFLDFFLTFERFFTS